MVKLYEGCKDILKNKIYFDEKTTHVYEVDDEIIGYFSLKPMLGCLNIDYELLESYRNKGMGNKFLENITDYAAKKYADIEKLMLLIEYNNIKSKKIAEQNGYDIDYSIFVDGESELHNTNVYTKKNRYYK